MALSGLERRAEAATCNEVRARSDRGGGIDLQKIRFVTASSRSGGSDAGRLAMRRGLGAAGGGGRTSRQARGALARRRL